MLKRRITLLFAVIYSFSLMTATAFAAAPFSTAVAEPIAELVSGSEQISLENFKKISTDKYSYSINYGAGLLENIVQENSSSGTTTLTVTRGDLCNVLVYQGNSLLSVNGIDITVPAGYYGINNRSTIVPYGNLASIYYSDTPFYGTSSTYSVPGGASTYSVDLVLAVNELTMTAFIYAIKVACPPLGKAIDALSPVLNSVVNLYNVMVGSPSLADLCGLYVKESNYVPPTQPTPLTVVYNKYLVQYYSSPSYSSSSLIGNLTTTYYTKMVYNLYG